MPEALLITEAGTMDADTHPLIRKAHSMLKYIGTVWRFTPKGVRRGGDPERRLTVYGVLIQSDRSNSKVQFAATDETGHKWCFPKDSLYERVN